MKCVDWSDPSSVEFEFLMSGLTLSLPKVCNFAQTAKSVSEAPIRVSRRPDARTMRIVWRTMKFFF